MHRREPKMAAVEIWQRKGDCEEEDGDEEKEGGDEEEKEEVEDKEWAQGARSDKGEYGGGEGAAEHKERRGVRNKLDTEEEKAMRMRMRRMEGEEEKEEQ